MVPELRPRRDEGPVAAPVKFPREGHEEVVHIHAIPRLLSHRLALPRQTWSKSEPTGGRSDAGSLPQNLSS
jgi:hypothetical protein